jgi:microcystin-dependent protein
MSDPFVAEIRIFAGNFEPNGWAFCDGRLIPIAQNTALFSLLGTTYGGDGRTTFALPDLRGRAPMHAGDGPGLSPRSLGESAGTETVTITPAQAPAHTHALNVSTGLADSASPSGNFLANSGTAALYASGPADTPLSAAAVTPVGGEQPHNNLMPYLTVSFIIALQGVFPPRT